MFPWYMFVGLLNQDEDEDEDEEEEKYEEKDNQVYHYNGRSYHSSDRSIDWDFYCPHKSKSIDWLAPIHWVRYIFREFSNLIRGFCWEIRDKRETKLQFSYFKKKRIHFKSSKYKDAKAFLKNFITVYCAKLDKEFFKNKESINEITKSCFKEDPLKLQTLKQLKDENKRILKLKKSMTSSKCNVIIGADDNCFSVPEKFRMTISKYIKSNKVYNAAKILQPLIFYVDQNNLTGYTKNGWSEISHICFDKKDFIKFGKYKGAMVELIYELKEGSLKKTLDRLPKKDNLKKDL